MIFPQCSSVKTRAVKPSARSISGTQSVAMVTTDETVWVKVQSFTFSVFDKETLEFNDAGSRINRMNPDVSVSVTDRK